MALLGLMQASFLVCESGKQATLRSDSDWKTLTCVAADQMQSNMQLVPSTQNKDMVEHPNCTVPAVYFLQSKIDSWRLKNAQCTPVKRICWIDPIKYMNAFLHIIRREIVDMPDALIRETYDALNVFEQQMKARRTAKAAGPRLINNFIWAIVGMYAILLGSGLLSLGWYLPPVYAIIIIALFGLLIIQRWLDDLQCTVTPWWDTRKSCTTTMQELMAKFPAQS
jgi:hypothetical protein